MRSIGGCWNSLDSAVSEIESDRELRVVVIRARGLLLLYRRRHRGVGLLFRRTTWAAIGFCTASMYLGRLAALAQPVIAAVTGHALGGGLELALAADLRIAVQAAKFGSPEVTLGMICGWMGVRRLAETIGVARARHLTLLGAPITAAQALDWGLITALAEDADDLERQLNGWLEKLGGNAPGAMALTKGILSGMHADHRQHHASAAAQALSTEDCAEGLRAFREKRKPVYRNR